MTSGLLFHPEGSDTVAQRTETFPEWAFWALLLSISFYYVDLRFALNGFNSGASPQQLVDGTAITPFQYRALIPWTIALLTRVLTALHADWHPAPLPLLRLLELIATMGVVLTFRALLRRLIPENPRADLHRVLSLSIFYVLFLHLVLPRSIPVYYPWDTPSCAFFIVGLTLLYRRQWKWFYPIFILATFNRETSCFLTLAYVLAYRQRDSRLPIHVGTQLLLWSAIKAFLRIRYHHNGGAGAFEWYEHNHRLHLVRNLTLLRTPRAYPLLLSAFGYLWLPALLVRRKISDEFIQRVQLLPAVVMVGFLVVGNLDEVRLFAEFTVIPLVACVWVMVRGVASARSEMRASVRSEQGITAP